MKRPSLTNNKVETEMFDKRFYVLFSKMWKIGVIYKADKIEKRADS